MQIGEQTRVDLAGRRRARDRATVGQESLGRGDGIDRRLEVGLALGLAHQLGQPLLHCLEVGQDQLGVHRLDVAVRIDARVDVDDVVVVEGAHHLADGVGLADGRQELVAQPLSV